MLIRNSTITGNSAPSASASGGGVASLLTVPSTIEVTNSVISGNTNPNAPDISATLATTTVRSSAIGSAAGFTLSSSSSGNLPFGTNLMLGPLADNGGRTLTMAPQAGSPLIDAGANLLVPINLNTDQRGFGFSRINGSAVDIGAVELDRIRPALMDFSFDFETARQSLRYTFSEPIRGIDPAALRLENLTNSTFVPLAVTISGNHATFTFPAYPDGILPNGDYRAILRRDFITDFSGNKPAADQLNTFFFLKGDLNHDRQVSISDFIDLSSNFGKSSATYSMGDLNYDQTISISDFIDLAASFNVSLGPPPADASPQAAASLQIDSEPLVFKRKPRLRHHLRKVKMKAPGRFLNWGSRIRT
jgi:hypothetical protein